MGKNSYVIGVDFGSDSVRAIIVDTKDGKELSESVFNYPRWKEGLYCNPLINQFRQHPLDYIEGLTYTIKDVISKAGDGISKFIKAIAFDTTGSTPCAVDKNGTPLALLPKYETNPNAMFILWKDHTAIEEAKEINLLSHSGKYVDYTKFLGGSYSSEWFWAKILRTLRVDKEVREDAFSWVEHSDWMVSLLTGNRDPLTMNRSRCSSGHKAMWHKSFDGIPAEDFLEDLDPLLKGLRNNINGQTVTAEVSNGNLSEEWAKKLGLSEDVIIGGSAIDAHIGAVGAGIKAYDMVKVIGTSTCDIVVVPTIDFADSFVNGICGQVDGSVIPGMVGLEAGQAAFGDYYAWFKKTLLGPSIKIINSSKTISPVAKIELLKELDNNLLKTLEEGCEKSPKLDDIIALDWINGRRTPDANQELEAGFIGLNISTSAYKMYKSIIDATAFGARKIQDRFTQEGINIKRVIATGGISRKSKLVMQTLADVLNREIIVSSSEQTCALGSSMFAAVSAGIYSDIRDAQEHMGCGYDYTYTPIPKNVEIYENLYHRYLSFANYVEVTK
ncbi:MAG: ribulokinase [Spirochaetaceae bacterium]